MQTNNRDRLILLLMVKAMRLWISNRRDDVGFEWMLLYWNRSKIGIIIISKDRRSRVQLLFGSSVTRLEDGVTRLEDRVTRLEDWVMRLEDRVTRLESVRGNSRQCWTVRR